MLLYGPTAAPHSGQRSAGRPQSKYPHRTHLPCDWRHSENHRCNRQRSSTRPKPTIPLIKKSNAAQSDSRRTVARLTIRAILTNPVITAPIPGIITPEQVDNVAIGVLQRRALDATEQAELDAATDRAFANLPYHYRWLNDWTVV